MNHATALGPESMPEELGHDLCRHVFNVFAPVFLDRLGEILNEASEKENHRPEVSASLIE